MEPIRLNYGRQTLEIAASGAKRMKMLLETPMPEIETIQEEFRRCVEEGAICARPLRELVASEDSVTIVISDMTRFWMRQDIICELLVRYLNETLARSVSKSCSGGGAGNPQEEYAAGA